MGNAITRGCIVVVPFAYKEATGAKVRPALALTNEQNNEVILCMITSAEPPDGESIALHSPTDLVEGLMPVPECYIRPNRLFTANTSRAPRVRARLNPQKTQMAVDRVIERLSRDK